VEAARIAVEADVPVLAVLHAEARASMEAKRGGLIWSMREAAGGRTAAEFLELLDDERTLALVGTIDESVVGYALSHIEDLDDGAPLAVVDDLYVDPEARSVGVGEALMNAVVAWGTEEGCVGVDAWALPGDRATKNFFEAFGLTARAILVHKPLTDDAPAIELLAGAPTLDD